MSKKHTNDEFIEKLKIFRPSLIPLEEYHGVDYKIQFQCKDCGYIFESTPYILLKKKKVISGCKKCNGLAKKTHEEYLIDLQVCNKNIVPLEQYKTSCKNILHKCNICGYEWMVKPSNLLSGFGCPACHNKKVLKGYNDLWTTHPEMAKLLADPEDGHKYTYGSGKRADWKCPNCGTIVKSKMIMDVVRYNHVPCKQCSDGVSYPMKFVISVLEQLYVDYETERKFDWCRFVLNDKETFGIYDIVATINNQKYIIEIDGAFHFKDNLMNGQTEQVSKYIDSEKDRLAVENGYEVIRIMALSSTIEYMKNSLLTSGISNILDMTDVDWNKANNDALSSLVVESARLWNIYERACLVAEKMGKRQEVIVTYLNKAAKAGLCNYDGHIEKIKSAKRNGKYLRKQREIVCIE